MRLNFQENFTFGRRTSKFANENPQNCPPPQNTWKERKAIAPPPEKKGKEKKKIQNTSNVV